MCLNMHMHKSNIWFSRRESNCANKSDVQVTAELSFEMRKTANDSNKEMGALMFTVC